MTEQEYKNIQALLSRKLTTNMPMEMRTGKRNEGYKTGILAAKSIINTYYLSQKTEKPSVLEYTPTCPRGYTDCVCDPAYIKFNYPKWYKNLYGDKTLEEAASGCRERVREDPNEEYYCYDNEDK